MTMKLETEWGPLVKQAVSADLFGYDRESDIEMVYDPFTSFLQIGMGGEWWSLGK